MFKNITSAFKVSIIYFIFSLLWIYYSDNAINFLVKDFQELQYLQTIKGWFFVTISSILLYILTRQFFINLQKEKDKLTNANYILEEVIENAPVIIFWKDKNGVYQGANKQLLEIMNLKNKEELIGKKDSDFNISEKEDFVNDDLYVMTNKKPKLNYSETITTKNKEKRVLNSSKVPLFDNTGKVIGVLGVVQDITEQSNRQEQIKSQEQLLIQQSKLASMGEMIANIAHQWRQPLSVISMLATGIKLQKELKLSDEQSEIESLELINDNAQYLSKTIDDFKNFFKESTIKNKVYSDDIVKKTLKLILPRLKNQDIKIVENYENVEFNAYESELIQVFINIINNSIDALEEIEADKFIFIKTNKINNNLVIQIKDNAGGIREEIIDKIFEPYFTTKDEKQGTGIGLFMCNEIVVKHLRGTIFVVNESFEYLDKTYKGSLFTIKLPLV
jgi:PAS domain S-box-containing protein